ncbi:MAG: ATP-binding cassette domain-containing protein [Planctomycetota bacterium]|nr:ATP-binding cassette domain-containing protein [Planctomycetota bacterium]
MPDSAAPESTGAIEFRGVSKRFPGGTLALDGLTLSVAPGELVALLGSSGSGKTTALKLINRMEEPGAGEILIDGQNTAQMDPIALRRSIGYVIQEGGLFPHWTVEENVGLVPRLLGWETSRIAARVKDVMALAQVPHEEFGARYSSTLSGGQRQRVAIARALAAESRMLLLDEPFSALDPITREALHAEVKALVARLGVTTVLVTHDVEEAFKLAQRVALMDKGRLIQFGTPEALLLRPAHEYTRRFFEGRAHDLKLRYLVLARVAPYLEPADPEGRAVETIDGGRSPETALGQMLESGAEFFAVRTSGGAAGPFRIRDLWRSLKEGSA